MEIRALDAQASLADTGALVTLVHCLARHATDSNEAADPPPEVLEDGIFRAARFGVEAELPSVDGTLRPVGDVLEEALGRAAVHAGEPGCEEEIARLPDPLRRGGGAGMQRRYYELAGLDAVLRELISVTAATA